MQKWIEQAAEFPRPDRVRQDTTVLDGKWDFEYDRLSMGITANWLKKKNWRRKIRVPFCVESELSGIGNKFPPGTVWYRKVFDAPDSFEEGKRLLLNFGAVDYKAEVWINGTHLGMHRGGYSPFSFDITKYVKSTGNELVVRVSDSLDPRIPRGKQSFAGVPFLIYYTNVTGIWQSVWLETTGRGVIDNISVNPDAQSGNMGLSCDISGCSDAGWVLEARALSPDGTETEQVGGFDIIPGDSTNVQGRLSIENPQLWAPGSPSLYRLTLTLVAPGGEVHDRVQTYFGFRTIEVKDGEILLNGEPAYLKFLLNQGYFSGGHYTPEHWNDFRRDVEQALEMGFNGVRMHQKIENPKFLFFADALGFLVWAEMPSGFVPSKKLRTALRDQWPQAIARDIAHPCIIAWVPFCEGWGIQNVLFSESGREFVREIVGTTKQLDPTRPVVDSSGFWHVETDILDIHQYLGTAQLSGEFYDSLDNPGPENFTAGGVTHVLDPSKKAVDPLAPTINYDGQPFVISEYGGFGFYKTEKKPLAQMFREYTMEIARRPFIKGYCYTQQYDTEQEQNGLLTFEREPKFPLEDIRKINDEVDEITGKRNRSRS